MWVRQPQVRSFSLTPASVVSVHKGYKIRAALCCDRLPLKSPSVEAFEKWNSFREKWALKTDCAVRIPDDLVFMRFPFHWLESAAEIEYKKRQQVTGTEAQGEQSGVDALLENEGLGFDFGDLADVESGPQEKKKQTSAKIDDDPRSPFQREERCIWLIVKYKGQDHWQFPAVDHVPRQSMRETLQKLCLDHFGPMMSPYFVGMAPFARLKRKEEACGLKGNNTFFYRCHWMPGSKVVLDADSPVEDYKFATRDELKEFLPAPNWRSVRYGLPLE
eukprot:GEMP01089304.1.p1 GENE.GEMP01089304.1~~GEMP01089304.1.p1  ORF type:complete len:295 (+),score=60.64 GEMP01089304.1:61-885(+)